MPTSKQKSATPSENPIVPEETATFSQLGLDSALVKALQDIGYETPTPIQQRTIPILLQGRDVIGQAQTGTGKTAAFSLPLLQSIDPKLNAVQGLVLTPTRELALQVSEAIHSYCSHKKGVSVLPVYGGESMQRQLTRLEKGVHIVVGTPGRIMDHMRRKSLRLSNVRMLVLDEADEMLRMGFIEDVTWILEHIPTERQVALFSATLPPEIKAIAHKHLQHPAHVHIQQKTVTVTTIDQQCIVLSEHHKMDALTRILDTEVMESTLIFTRTKAMATQVAQQLEHQGYKAEALHSDISQAQRQTVLRRLRDKKSSIVVATDVAARGLDINHISHVINYDMPNDVETYVHRIGRTGRIGKTGIAILFVTPRERNMLQQVERYTKQPIRSVQLPTLAQVKTKRAERTKNKLREVLQHANLAAPLHLVTELAKEGTYDLAAIAAAALHLAEAQQPAPSHKEIDLHVPFSKSTSSDRNRKPTGRFGRSAPAGDRKRRSASPKTEFTPKRKPFSA